MGTWHASGSIELGRIAHVAIRIAGGGVLIAGGIADDEPDAEVIATVERWEPGDGAWRAAAPMTAARWAHAACPIDGGALVFGGVREPSFTGPVHAVERWDAARDRWEVCGETPALSTPCQAMALDDDGPRRILLIGASDDVAIWDVAAARAIPASPPPIRTGGACALRLADGRVLLIGGYRARGRAADRGAASPAADRGAASPAADRADRDIDAAIWDPRDGAWMTAGRLARPRHDPSATRLHDGSVLVVGGYDYDANCTVAGVERWRPGVAIAERAHGRPQSRTMHAAALAPDGSVLIIAGHHRPPRGGGGALSHVERYDPVTSTLLVEAPLHEPRRSHRAVALDDGVLIVGGTSEAGPVCGVEIWRP